MGVAEMRGRARRRMVGTEKSILKGVEIKMRGGKLLSCIITTVK